MFMQSAIAFANNHEYTQSTAPLPPKSSQRTLLLQQRLLFFYLSEKAVCGTHDKVFSHWSIENSFFSKFLLHSFRDVENSTFSLFAISCPQINVSGLWRNSALSVSFIAVINFTSSPCLRVEP